MPDERVHIADTGCFGDEQAVLPKQGADAAERAGQVTYQMQIVEPDDDIELHVGG
ncbi:hypothetical protein D3C78_1618510 [compost metagenome]